MTPALYDDPAETPLGKHSFVLECEQRSPIWLSARSGKPTGSAFSNIVTPTGKPVKGEKRQTYLCKLLQERVTGILHDNAPPSVDIERGIRLEPAARAWYEIESGDTVRQVGFVMHESRKWGVSPDGLIDARNTGLEIKCPGPTMHVRNSLLPTFPPMYTVQIQACMWVCERDTWQFVMYTEDHGLRSVVATVEKDEKMHAAFREELPKFCAELDAAVERAQQPAWGRR